MLVSDVQHTNLTLYKLQNSHHNKSLPSLTIHNCYYFIITTVTTIEGQR